MFLPIGDAPNPKGTPFVTRALEHGYRSSGPPDQYLLTALETGRRPETAAAVRQELAAIESQQKLRVGQLRRPGW